jgi:type 1 glutamine amidotransferase
MKTLISHAPMLLRSLALLFVLTATSTATAADLKLLFMGDNGHHRPSERFHELAPVMEARGIELKYTDRMEDLTAETLAGFDGLVLFANIDKIEDAQAKAVLDYVASGKGFIPLHCATFCWRNNAEIVKLMGGQFQRHGGQVFGVVNADPTHPIMKDFGGFTSWDETYIHTLHNEENRTVLEYRTSKVIRLRAIQKNHGHGFARMAKAEFSTRRGDMIHAPGQIPAFQISSNAASAGPAEKMSQSFLHFMTQNRLLRQR